MIAALVGLMLVAGEPLPEDPTKTERERCLTRRDSASTAGQVACEVAALKAYDRRMNAAYASVLASLPDAAARQLRAAQRAWLGFRNDELAFQAGLFATKRGTMFVPMQAACATTLTRDRALQLEAYRRIRAID